MYWGGVAGRAARQRTHPSEEDIDAEAQHHRANQSQRIACRPCHGRLGLRYHRKGEDVQSSVAAQRGCTAQLVRYFQLFRTSLASSWPAGPLVR